ncbi:MAG: bifunctional UDP-N-acetylglucosamine diphosphorylase/glucosamine-1-phosphate N-acetyltransferase GlmU [Moraxellaceae bacterium]|nr:bifunctional UDP-N-acetylglucosamine diphosphorylase/glucosamine-1-phosphate N-acetyltransferase GlmU [Moraxellaceae bacterium]
MSKTTSQTPLTAIILAGGQGTRMKSTRPKVLQTLANKPLLAHVLDTCLHNDGLLNIKKTIAVYGFEGEQVTSAMANYTVTWVEQAQQLGTGHAVQVTLDELPTEGKSLILYGDVPLISAKTLLHLTEANTDGISMLTLTVANPFGLGRIKRDNDNKVLAIVEEKDASEEERTIQEINSGIYCVDNVLLHKYLPLLKNDNAQQEYYLTDIVKMAVEDNINIQTIEPEHDFEIEGVNTRQQLAILERKWQAKLVEDLQIEGVQFADPNRVDIRGAVAVGHDVFIDVNVVFKGDCKLGNNVTIEAGCIIENSEIGDNCHIKQYCVINESQLAKNIAVGPFAHLRPQTHLEDNCKVGNFVEIKKSYVGKGSKINHLSYIGDANIGEDVNIGAGTITCNYDGVNKSLTKIGDNAFIGSNSSLVAPVKIGAMATIGAGSVITKEAKAGKLTLTRAKQHTINHWQRPVKK